MLECSDSLYNAFIEKRASGFRSLREVIFGNMSFISKLLMEFLEPMVMALSSCFREDLRTYV